MPLRLDTAGKGFAGKFSRFLALSRGGEGDVREVVASIIGEVRIGGDKALIAYTKKFDRVSLSAARLRVSAAEIASARKNCPAEVRRALIHAARRIRAYHERQMPKDLTYRDKAGVTLGWRWNPLESAGIYVPGGTASYPSSVLMNAIPARVAGVDRIAMTVPTPGGTLNPAVLAAAEIAGVNEIYRIGGAQAIAALAYGTKSIPPVDKIVGPGNAYVAEAKRQVFGRVGIDLIAGPSEILVVADAKNDPRWIAADLLSQAEHDALAQSILITEDAAFAERVEREIASVLKTLPRAETARAAWKKFGAVILVRDLAKEAPDLINRIAPEHLELAVANPEALARRVRHAGAIFLGRHTPEAIGDYLAGPSHVLPTSRTARFSSGLSVYDFLTRSSLMGCDAAAFAALARDADILARAEGLDAHARSVSVRR